MDGWVPALLRETGSVINLILKDFLCIFLQIQNQISFPIDADGCFPKRLFAHATAAGCPGGCLSPPQIFTRAAAAVKHKSGVPASIPHCRLSVDRGRQAATQLSSVRACVCRRLFSPKLPPTDLNEWTIGQEKSWTHVGGMTMQQL